MKLKGKICIDCDNPPPRKVNPKLKRFEEASPPAIYLTGENVVYMNPSRKECMYCGKQLKRAVKFKDLEEFNRFFTIQSKLVGVNYKNVEVAN